MVEIKDSKGQPVWFARINKKSITLEFESYGSKAGEPDIESVKSISSSEFQKIREHFGYSGDYSIGDLLQELSDAGQGEEFKEWATENLVIKSKFVWFSFGD